MNINLTPDQLAALSIAAYLVGAVVRAVWPYVLKKVQTGDKFDLRYIVGQALVTAGGLFVLLVNQDIVLSLGSLGIVGGLIAGFAAASIGRNSQKTVAVVRK